MGERLQRMLWILIALPLLALGALAAAAHHSRGLAPDYGLEEGRLRACPARPNCVCSDRPATLDGQALEPLPLAGRDPGEAWTAFQAAVADAGGEVVLVAGDYLAATFRTPWLGFVDDLEARLDRAAGVIHVRSASRVGRSDLGANRARVTRLAAGFGSDAAKGDG